MRRFKVSLLALVVVLVGLNGCIAVSSKQSRYYGDKAVVATDDRVYVVDTRTGDVSYVELRDAQPYEPSPGECDDD